MKPLWMIYGANGYTGQLIAREAANLGMTPVLAGRNSEQLRVLAQELGLQFRVFSLDDFQSVHSNIHDMHLVLNCAGPFSSTAIPMQEECLNVGAHYLDITGEAYIFEHTLSEVQNKRAIAAGVVLCSGVGFDVIPTDCVALRLKELLPDATDLALGFDSNIALSPGTTKTAIEALGLGSLERIDGILQSRPIGIHHRYIDFGRGKRSAMTISWGDVSTAYHTTGIPNIRTWIPMPAPLVWGAKLMGLASPLLTKRWVQHSLQNLAGKLVTGPDALARAELPTYVWGEARNQSGARVTVRIRIANIYSMTVSGALHVTQYLLNTKNNVKGGSYTPAMLFGTELITSLPGSHSFQIEK
ncbi:MAG: saccharopine dehydrogenase NADP-binding domain-containing protein [Acinetobacter venetianus]|uniref:saccharopine dehydrogenase family protein n=1 Tax=Acinetobacter venetianus TaxID=52133 RepID=UPI003C794408